MYEGHRRTRGGLDRSSLCSLWEGPPSGPAAHSGCFAGNSALKVGTLASGPKLRLPMWSGKVAACKYDSGNKIIKLRTFFNKMLLVRKKSYPNSILVII